MVDEDDEIDKLWRTSIAGHLPKSPALVVDNKNKAQYTAFEAKDKPLGFVVRCSAINYTFFYHNLLTIALDSPNDDFFTVITNNAVIQVYGRNLQPVADAFGMHGCASVNEYSPELFLPPSDDSQPYIEKIKVMLPTPVKKQEREAKSEEKQGKEEA
jgi:hypothetical protein